MPSYDLKVFNARTREIRRLVRRASPALVYSGPLGIAIMAPLRAGTRWRIGKVMDRMAIIGRGDPGARELVHRIASAEARSVADRTSNGDVKGQEPANAVSTFLSSQNSRFTLGTSAPVEVCFTQLNATPDQDYLAYIALEGTRRSFRKVWFLGEAEEREHTSTAQREEAAEKLNEELAGKLGDYERFEDLWAALDQPTLPTPVRALRASAAVDVVVLHRDALRKRDFRTVFQRLTL